MPRPAAAGLLMTLSLAPLLGQPAAAEDGEGRIAIADIRAQVFLERSGRLSEDLSRVKRPFRNLSRVDGDLGEPSTAMFVTLVFSGPKNGEASRVLARDIAQVTVKQTVGEVTKTLLFRAYGGFSFGETGEAYKAFLLDDATCGPLEIDVKVGRTRKTAPLDLPCDRPAVAQADVATTGSVKRRPIQSR